MTSQIGFSILRIAVSRRAIANATMIEAKTITYSKEVTMSS
ncbi:MAG: hypothetical protein V3R35_07375 [Woeseiaceae bacterium]